MLQRVAKLIMWVGGWQAIGSIPDEPKAVFIAAPHTSNWDGFWALTYKVAVGLDVRGTTLSARGWTRDGGELFDTLARLDREGCARYVVTDVARDGTLEGPNLELLHSVCEATDRPVVASGGVGSLGDLHSLAELIPVGLEGAIIGKALYSGAFTLPEAIVAAEPRHSYVRPQDYSGTD